MRRFERLLHKPVTVWELEVVGTEVVTREDGREHRTGFDSEQAATAHAGELISHRKASGYVEIKRLPAVEHEPSVHRDERFEWKDGPRTISLELAQRDHEVRRRDGEIVDGYGRAPDPQITRAKTIREASALFDRQVEAAHAEIERAQKRTSQANVRHPETATRRARIAARSAHVHPELEAECRASADSVAPWLVYADWLIAQGDPIGEIAALARDNVAAAKRLVATTFEELRSDHEVSIAVRFRHGFVRHLLVRPRDDLSVPLAELVATALQSSCCRFVDSVRVGLASRISNENDWSETVDAIAASPQGRTLRVLRLDAYDSIDNEISWVPYGDLSTAWPKLPALEELAIRAGLDGNLGTLALPHLRRFVRQSGGLRRHDVEAACALPRPNLEHLALWTGTTRYGGEITMSDLAPILDARGLPALHHLGIVNSELSDELIPALARSRILPQLSSLDLSDGICARAATDTLLEHAAAFRHLAAFDLSNNVLRPDEVEQIRGVLDNVIVGGQRENDREDDFPGDPGERYIALGE